MNASPGPLHVFATCLALMIGIDSCGCAISSRPSVASKAHLPLLKGWFDGQEVFYVTTDVSDAAIADAKGANFVPLLANALPSASARAAGAKTAADKVYAVVNHDQPSVFGSAPDPVGSSNTLLNYSPLWRLVKVTWRRPAEARVLTSEESVLAAADRGDVEVEMTNIVLNCPIIHRGARGGLPGVSIDGYKP